MAFPVKKVQVAEGAAHDQAHEASAGPVDGVGERSTPAWGLWAATIAYALVLSLITVVSEIRTLGGLVYLQSWQIGRHLDVMNGTALDPWTYRVLSDLAVDGLHNVLRWLGTGNSWNHPFVSFRLAQNAAIFVLAAVYYRKLGLSRAATAFGLGLIAWALTQAIGGDLKFDTWSDLIFYLVGALIVLRGDSAFPWIIPLTALAAVNRESSGLIPVMLLAVALRQGLRTPAGQRTALIGLAALVVWAAVYVGLRHMIGPRELFRVYGHGPGFDLFAYNVSRHHTWLNLFHMVSILPFACIYAWRWWSPQLKMIGLTIGAPWVLLHFFVASADETRLFAVPLALVFVPGALLALTRLEPRPYTWTGLVAPAASWLRGGRALVATGAIVLVGSLFMQWYSLERIQLPYSPALPGPESHVTAWSYLHAAKIAMAVLGVAGLALALSRSRRAVGAAALVVAVAAVAVVYRQLTATPGLHFFPPGPPQGLLPGVVPPPPVPRAPPDLINAVSPLPGAYLGLAGAMAMLCGALLAVVATWTRTARTQVPNRDAMS